MRATDLSKHREGDGGTLLDGHLSSCAVHVDKLVGAEVGLEQGGQDVRVAGLREQLVQKVAGLQRVSLDEFLRVYVYI